MILIPDVEGEAFVNENDWDTIVPVSFSMIDGVLRVEYYPEVREEIEAFFQEYGENPFSDEALEDLFQRLAPYMEQKGYADDRFRDRWGYIFRGVAAASAIGAAKLSVKDADKNKTTYDITESLSDGRLVYGVKEGNDTVSVAVTHAAPEDAVSGILEVGVETIPAFRGRGYAVAALAALSKELHRRGITTEYRCQRYNGASRKVALRAGLCEVGRYYYYVGRKKDGV